MPFVLVGLFRPQLYWVLDTSSYLVLHNLAELFSVMVSLSIFGVGWFAYSRSRDSHSLFLSLTFLAVGLLDLMHTLGYSGMTAFFTPNSPNKSTQFWIAARFFTAAALLASAFVPRTSSSERVPRPAQLALALAYPAAAFVLVTFWPDRIPATYVEGSGLTIFKRVSEVVIIAVLAVAFLAYLRRMAKTKDDNIVRYLAAFELCILSELSFTVYKSVFDTYNVIGHCYKVIAFSLIYRATFVSAIAVPYDALRKTIAEKETLLRELYHRTKNTMQTVQSLLVLQGSEYLDDAAVQDLIVKTEKRIQAIKLVHEKLYAAQDLSRIPIGQYSEELAELLLGGKLSETGGISLRMEMVDEMLMLDTAIPFGLILSELLSNSLKHAFPEGRSGTISIKVEKRSSGFLRMTYADDGIGVPETIDPRSGKSLGLQLIVNLGESQMRGTVSFARENGFACEVEFPTGLYKPRV